MNVVRAHRGQMFEYGPFTIRRLRPGERFGPLAIVDMTTLKLGARIPMQKHINDDILNYVWRGSVQHTDSSGERTPLSAKRIMVVNAGEGLQYEESAPLIEAEVLQAFIRPSQAGGEAKTQLLERADGAARNAWTWLAGPEGSDAPLTLRQAVQVYDVRLERGKTIEVPVMPGYAAWLVVLDGVVSLESQRLHKGDVAGDSAALPPVFAERDATLICFLVDAEAAGVMSGTVSGS
ncbi:pirin family protein [Pantoea sp. KPR_PJ]|uniref:pirin family protein n=1 Tax=Pantoea sp. KPR_PJ TaxID=2738375 RepID=UPI003527788D